MKEQSSKPTAIDLFCGCGGLSYGFVQAGFDVLLGVDNSDIALQTFKVNHGKGCNALNLDLSKESSLTTIKDAIGDAKLDLIIAGPPCQGFSLTGPRNFYDERNRLYRAVLDTVRLFRPKAFLIENVPGMATLYGGAIKDEIIEKFSECGYKVKMDLLRASDYGVPQIRKRVFFVGVLPEYGDFQFPSPTHSTENYITCWDAISDLPSRENDMGKEIDCYDRNPVTDYQRLMRNGSTTLYNHVATNHTDLVKSVISLVPEGGNHKDLPPGVGESRKFNEAWTRYHSKKPSRTIDTGHRNHFHYKYNRVPTVRENARLQSFPDNFVFYGTKTQQYRQVGNAVPCLLGYNIAKQLLRYIGGDFGEQ